MDLQVTLVYFSCKGREHLLKRTAEALDKYQSFAFHEKILAFDGPLRPGFQAADIGVNKLVTNVSTAGYVLSIKNALSLISTPYFFWQEDDCRFLRPIDLNYLLGLMEDHPDWVQVGWGIGEKFPSEEKIHPIERENMYYTATGFSARPALCRTNDLREAFELKERSAINTNQDVEEYLRDWLRLKSKKSVSMDPGDNAIYSHDGQLESVNKRLLQVTLEQTDEAETYKSALGHKALPCLSRRIINMANLCSSAVRLCFSQFYKLSRYDVAWRVVNIERNTRN